MKVSTTLIWLVALIVLLAVVSSGVGLLYQTGESPFPFTSVRGESVEMYGQGIYRFETLRDGTGFKGTDLYVLVVAVPLLVISAVFYRRGSWMGGLVLSGMLGYFLYNSASMTFGYAYNNLFPVYLAQFTASLFATVLAYRAFDSTDLHLHFRGRLPRRGIATFLFVLGGALILVWGVMDILPALLTGKAPLLTGHTTLPTHALDMGIVSPLAIVAGILLLRRTHTGYLLTANLLVISVVLGAGVLALSAAQVLAGVLTVPQIMVFVVPFVILTGFALLLTYVLFRNFSDGPRVKRGIPGLRVAKT